MPIKRMRVFAGPNGSGKTTIISSLRAEVPFGVYVNADDMERLLRETGVLLLDAWLPAVDEDALRQFFKFSTFSPIKRQEPDLYRKLRLNGNVLHIDAVVDSYLAADLAEFIRQNLMAGGVSFTYETVMSHEGKIGFLKQARENGYRTYLYFVATEDPEINVSRVQVRMAQKGHAVAAEVIRNRYYKSLRHLKHAVQNSDRAYIFDNSGTAALLIAEITNGTDVVVLDTDKVPGWFLTYLTA